MYLLPELEYAIDYKVLLYNCFLFTFQDRDQKYINQRNKPGVEMK